MTDDVTAIILHTLNFNMDPQKYMSRDTKQPITDSQTGHMTDNMTGTSIHTPMFNMDY